MSWIDPGQGMAKIGYAVVAVIIVSGIFSFWQEFKVERTLAALRELLPQQVEVLRDGKVAWLLADQLVPGDVVVLEQGNNIPADCRLIEAFGVRVNNTTVTDKDCPDSRPIMPRRIGKVVAIPRVGGLHHRYELSPPDSSRILAHQSLRRGQYAVV